MRVLWLSNKQISKVDSSGTGSWLDAMAQGLIASGVTLGNVSEGAVRNVIKSNACTFPQWVVPPLRFLPDGNFDPTSRTAVKMACDEFAPDLLHVWGTEAAWGLMTTRKILGVPALLEMQGLKSAIAEVYSGGLTFLEQLKCYGLKELIRNSSISAGQRAFKRWLSAEREIIAGHEFIGTQSHWTEGQIKVYNRHARTFRNNRMLRPPFYESPCWEYNGSAVIFSSAAYPLPFKGLHTLIRAAAVLRDRIPQLEVRIAGPHQRQGIRREGYIQWINSEIRRLGVASNIKWLGVLSAQEIVQELGRCAVFVQPSYVESYCVALAEAMRVGVPCVSSFTGGASFLGQDDKTVLFFPPGDHVTCAYQIERLIRDPAFSVEISHNARSLACLRNDPDRIVNEQLRIYRDVLALTEAGTKGGTKFN